MSDRGALRDYRQSRAVLIGTAEYRYLKDVPAAANSLRRMAGLLTSGLCGWAPDRVTSRLNEPGPGELAGDLITLFADAKDVALFYFVGHGQIDPEDELCLGLSASRADANLRAATSLPFQAVRRALRVSPASTKVVILDCCFAGLAKDTATIPAANDLLDRTAGAGAYMMAATGSYETAWFEVDGPQPQTYFTRYLADIVEAGIPGAGAQLRLDPIFTAARAKLAADSRPVPVARNIDFGANLIFAYNAASAGSARDEPDGADVTRRDRRGSVPADPGHQAKESERLIADLRAEAAELLDAGRWEAFRRVEARLRQHGASARPVATLQTSKGAIAISLLPDYAPRAVRNFIGLAEGTSEWKVPGGRTRRQPMMRLYDGTIFHRVIRGFLIQGGDPLATGTGGPGYQFADEFHPDLTFDKPYLLAMANQGPDSNGSQFFITVAAAPRLTGKHTIFGVVVDGHGVADAISRVPTRGNDRPVEPIVLQSVTVGGDLTGGG
jgi:cyclophilin family peptidyl-prolyl cis-trans isomerase